uniref:Folate gamma-glutamyl hydrolase n=1 Tax=Graphocephala atropunctata TaxID=36148 RepID=A0A1B6M624_9HEMI
MCRRCVTEVLLKRFYLDRDWKVLSTNVDLNGKRFISSIESAKYPIVGLQFHPEKNAFEWNPSQDISHSRKAVVSARYFFDWLVNEASKNNHSFIHKMAEKSQLIYNYDASFLNGFYEQIYFFR